MAAEVLPALHLLCLEGQPDASVCKFVAVRRHSGRPENTVSMLSDFLDTRSPA